MAQTTITFKDACELVNAGEVSPELIDKVKLATQALLLLAPIGAGLPFTAVEPGLGLLGLTGELASMGKEFLKWVTKQKDTDLLARQKRMVAAHSAICLSGFFEAVQNDLPSVWKSLDLSKDQIAGLIQSGFKTPAAVPAPATKEVRHLKFDLRPIPLPHPAESFETELGRLYAELTQSLLDFVAALRIVKLQAQEAQGVLQKAAKSLPGRSLEFYKGQYFELCAKFPDFYVWSNLQDQRAEREFRVRLSESIQSIPEQIRRRQVASVLTILKDRYQFAMERTDFSEEGGAGDGGVMFPKRSAIFVPQAFQVLRYKENQALEAAETWAPCPVRDDLEKFLLDYFRSPYCEESPLLILGNPGSGKSLLTHYIAATYGAELYTPVRVELRSVDAEAAISHQAELQIERDSSERVTWNQLMETIPELVPLLLLLDGYDELLQARGKSFSGYAKKVSDFQDECRRIWRKPLRALITSRIALIEKAYIPLGTTVIRLRGFQEPQRERWMGVWNQANATNFAARGVREFALPAEGATEAARKLLELATEPLLLLMLALYDAKDNALGRTQDFSEVQLYDALLRQFIERELNKNKDFSDLPSDQRREEMETCVERLSAVALGMYNRRALVIEDAEASADLKYFELERSFRPGEDPTLSQGELLLGGFFFVQKPQAISQAGRRLDLAYEFLHATFGEFLAANFIADAVLMACSAVAQHRGRNSDLERQLTIPKWFNSRWFASLIYNPLHTRSVVASMLRELVPRKLAAADLPPAGFEEALGRIVDAQLRNILSATTADWLPQERPPRLRELPALGHMAVYTCNLVVLRALLTPGFTIQNVPAQGESPHLWDRLTFMWRSWFQLESLAALGTIFAVDRSDDTVTIRSRTRAEGRTTGNVRIQRIRLAAEALGDDLLAGMTGLLAFNPQSDSKQTLSRTVKHLERGELVLDDALILAGLRLAFNRRLKADEIQDFVNDIARLQELGKRASLRTWFFYKSNAWYEVLRADAQISAALWGEKQAAAARNLEGLFAWMTAPLAASSLKGCLQRVVDRAPHKITANNLIFSPFDSTIEGQ